MLDDGRPCMVAANSQPPLSWRGHAHAPIGLGSGPLEPANRTRSRFGRPTQGSPSLAARPDRQCHAMGCRWVVLCGPVVYPLATEPPRNVGQRRLDVSSRVLSLGRLWSPRSPARGGPHECPRLRPPVASRQGVRAQGPGIGRRAASRFSGNQQLRLTAPRRCGIGTLRRAGLRRRGVGSARSALQAALQGCPRYLPFLRGVCGVRCL